MQTERASAFMLPHTMVVLHPMMVGVADPIVTQRIRSIIAHCSQPRLFTVR